MSDFEFLYKDQPETCIGLTFRGYRNFYYQDGRLELKQGIRLLKRKSCPGCEKCGWMLDELKELLYCDSVIMPEIEHGNLYSIRTINVSRDWETGYVDDYDIEIYEVEE